MYGEENDWITTREFVEALYANSGRTAVIGSGDAMSAARREGWIDAQDFLDAEEALTRRSAAVILHRFLLKVPGERDEDDITAAEELKDLYDCRVCVNHIAQVYVKGIMEGIEFCQGDESAGMAGLKTFRIFDGSQKVDRQSAAVYIGRVLERNRIRNRHPHIK